jgi:RecB family exonuclease
MKLTHLSASRIQTFEQCQMKYHATYDLELPQPPSHPNTLLGSAVHEMFEMATVARMKGADEAMQEPTFYLGDAFRTHKVKPSLTDVALQMTQDCKDWGYFRNIARTVGCEVEVDFVLSDDTKVTGFIDRLDVWDGTADIIDLKTGAHMYDDEELERNWQARIYSIAARKMHEITDEVTVSFWFLRHQVRKVIRTKAEAVADEKRLLTIANDIRSCTEPTVTPSGLCKWCPMYDTCEAAHESKRARIKRKYSKS